MSQPTNGSLDTDQSCWPSARIGKKKNGKINDESEVSNNRRFARSLPRHATEDDKIDFLSFTLMHTNWTQGCHDTLPEYYADDFSKISVDDFKKFDTDARRELRGFPRSKTAYLPRGRNVFIADALFYVV